MSAAGTTHTPSYTTSAPFLPDPTGPQAPSKQTAALVANMTMFNTSAATPISEAEMINILQKSALEGYQLASTLNRAANMTKVSANKAAAQDLQTQVEGEREHAKIFFGTAIGAAAANLGVGYKGSQMQNTGEGAVEQLSVKNADTAAQTATNNAAKPGAATLAAQQKKADNFVKAATDNQTKVQTQDARPSIQLAKFTNGMNLTDKQWDAIKGLFPIEEFDEPGPKGGRPYRKAREILDGVLWILRTGVPWKDPPRAYPPYQTCHRRFMK